MRLILPATLLLLMFFLAFATAQGSLAITLATDKPSYLTGEPVVFSGIVSMGGSPVSGATVVYQVDKPEKAGILAVGFVNTGSDGSYSKSFALPSNAPFGSYTIRVNVNQGSQQASQTANFQVQGGSATTSIPEFPSVQNILLATSLAATLFLITKARKRISETKAR